MAIGRPKTKLALSAEEQARLSSLAASRSLPQALVARYFALFGVQPHRGKNFKLSTDPFFLGKVRDVVGLCLNPPNMALILCADEKARIRGLERTQLAPPMGLGYVEGVTHDYHRRDTTTLFAALNVLDGSVIAQRKPPPPPPGISLVPQPLRAQCAGRACHPSDRRQLRNPQAAASQSLAGRAVRVIEFITRRLTRAGPIRSSAGSDLSPSGRSGAAPFAAWANWCAKSMIT